MSSPRPTALDALLRERGLAPSAADPLDALLDLLAADDAPTSVHDRRHAIDVHIADSLAGLEIPEIREARLLADLGAGAGLPGLVLATMLPKTSVVLVEAAKRKCDFLHRAVAAMKLDNAAVVWMRAEEWSAGNGRCDAVCARALAALPVLCEYAAPLLREGGVLVAWKGAVSDVEASDARAAAKHLGLSPDQVRHVTPFPGSEHRTLHVLRKVAPTPDRYPRRPGMATKRPLSANNLR